MQALLATFRGADGSIRAGLNEYRDPAAFRSGFEAHMRKLLAETLAAADGAELPTIGAPPDERPTARSTVAGFVGPAERGPTRPRLLLSWQAFEATYGAALPPEQSFLGAALRGFFDNGGTLAYVARVLGLGATSARVECHGAGPGPGLVFEARSPGAWGNRLAVRLEPGTRTGLRLGVLELGGDDTDAAAEGRLLGDYDNLGFDPAGPNPIGRLLNEGPRACASLMCTQWPATFVAPETSRLHRLAGGSDGAALDAQAYCGSAAEPGGPTGLAALAALDDTVLLCVPDQAHHRLPPEVRERIALEMVAQCERLQDRFALLGAIGSPDSLKAPCDSSFAAVFFPDVLVAREHGAGGTDGVAVSPVGHVAGVLARNDLAHGVQHAPDGEPIHGLLAAGGRGPLEPLLDGAQADRLLRRGISPLSLDAASGVVRLQAAVTTSIDESTRSVAQRRMVSFVQTSIARGTQWVQFEVQDEALRQRVRDEIANFLGSLWRSGALRGAKAEEAFYVKCDDTTTTPTDAANGRLIVQVGLALVEPPVPVHFTLVIGGLSPTAPPAVPP